MQPLLPAVLLALCAVQEAPAPPSGPPGLVKVRGGRTRIGSTPAEVESLVRQRPELALAVAGEAPQFTLEVEDFLLMPTEVTNEQYLAYVRATGTRPPRSWAGAALREGQRLFLEERAGDDVPEDGGFDPAAWWEEHWHAVAWEVPPGELLHPVVHVSSSEAQGYARWAGLRLMTEFEFQRAGRGDSARTYPWGEDWDDRRYCQSLHAGRDATVPVGSFPPGAAGGVYDLAGNVWEWTASPFDPYPGYEPLRVALKERTVEAFGPFSSEQRVVVGGSFQMDRTGVRLAIRKGTDPTQSTAALGFRCAASLAPGLDAAQSSAEDVAASALAREVEWNPSSAVVRRRWTSEAGTSKVPGYRVVTGYQQLLACPVTSLAASNPVELGALSARSGAVLVAFVDLPFATTTPALAPGTHLVAWRRADAAGSGAKHARASALAPDGLADLPGFRADADSFLFFDLQGTPRAALPAAPLVFSREKPGHAEVASDPAAGDALTFVLCLPSARTASKGFFVELELQAPAGTLGTDWE